MKEFAKRWWFLFVFAAGMAVVSFWPVPEKFSEEQRQLISDCRAELKALQEDEVEPDPFEAYRFVQLAKLVELKPDRQYLASLPLDGFSFSHTTDMLQEWLEDDCAAIERNRVQ